ncbi:glycosyltransferase family 4 protein [Nitrosococcus wardiae]|uniref:Glycosyltransferase family 4 protein n=1 Tax=Nitrosococcus wardiae TaxID=1814290 RepID=A0A4P7C5M6_9GAMM|nr:glycosyltransferase family 4 protein [Nitrosococcus wardiae]QBQ56162.1 glycosyltransferase family 4 protein [Nitrosococcus wardiae]
MKIAQVAPLYESVPPQYYGGTERVVSYLTEELVNQGHEVTLFASGDSTTKAKLYPIVDRALRLDQRCQDPSVHHVLLVDKVAKLAPTFDIVHFHIDYLHFPLTRALQIPHITTLHGRLDIPDLAPLYQSFPDMPLVSISQDQRRPLPLANWQATVYHGLPENLYTFRPYSKGYLAFLGRISPEKRVDRAIEIAIRTGMEIRIAAKVDKADKEYFEERIKPLLAHPLVHYIGEIGEKEKNDFLGQAYALLFPIDWPEPFGLVMIEAMACGTPVIAYRRGSVPEVLQDGETGFIVENLDEALTAVERIGQISRLRCRQVFEKRFSTRRMAKDYLEVYQAILEAPVFQPRLVS